MDIQILKEKDWDVYYSKLKKLVDDGYKSINGTKIIITNGKPEYVIRCYKPEPSNGGLELDDCINTFTGKKVNLVDPKANQIDIEDIAKGLAYKGHFSGQTPRFFSIAQHCVEVCDLMRTEHHDNPELMLVGLLHDASEAYIGDMVKPLKVHLEEFQRVENRLQEIIFDHFELDASLLEQIKPYDKKVQKMEYESFYGNKGSYFRDATPDDSRITFLSRFREYSQALEMKRF